MSVTPLTAQCFALIFARSLPCKNQQFAAADPPEPVGSWCIMILLDTMIPLSWRRERPHPGWQSLLIQWGKRKPISGLEDPWEPEEVSHRWKLLPRLSSRGGLRWRMPRASLGQRGGWNHKSFIHLILILAATCMVGIQRMVSQVARIWWAAGIQWMVNQASGICCLVGVAADNDDCQTGRLKSKDWCVGRPES